jgi:TolB-like protein
MLGGRRPFDGPSYAAVLHAIVTTVPERLRARMPGISPAIDALVMRLLEKDAALRPQSADEVVRVLGGMSHASSAVASVESRRERPSASQPRRGARRRGALVAAGATLAILAALAGYPAWKRLAGSDRPTIAALPVSPTSAASAAPSLAVLPFVNTGGNAADEPFTDGLTDELIGALGKVRGLRVIARSSVFALKGRNISARAIADTLGVNHVLEGTVRKSGDRLRVFAQLVSARNDSVLWSEQYDREVPDLFAVQEEIARAMAGALRLQLDLGDASPRGTSDPEARDLYLRGRFALAVHANRPRGSTPCRAPLRGGDRSRLELRARVQWPVRHVRVDRELRVRPSA